jgi:hypothetical protein
MALYALYTKPFPAFTMNVQRIFTRKYECNPLCALDIISEFILPPARRPLDLPLLFSRPQRFFDKCSSRTRASGVQKLGRVALQPPPLDRLFSHTPTRSWI